MIELYELRQFAAFADCGTLSDAAQRLHLSQPALSRNMKKLEEKLGVPIFIRSKNRLTLNENGKYARALAAELLSGADALAARVRDFDRRSRTLSLGVCAPAPVWLLAPLLSSCYLDRTIQTETAEEAALLSGLDTGDYQLIVLPQPPAGEGYVSRACCREQLMFALPRGHRYARRKSLSFAEMNGENMLLMNDIGFWNFVRTQKMPDSRFLVQSDRYSFQELIESSSLAAFTTDLANQYYMVRAKGRVEVPISDPEACVTYQLVCRREDERAFRALFSAL